MISAFQVEISVGDAEARNVRRNPASPLRDLIRVRLPFKFKPNPVAGEREFLSVGFHAFSRLRSRSVSLLNAVTGELNEQGLENWIINTRASHRLRTNADLWKTMVISAVLDAARDRQRQHLVANYFDGNESLAFALGR